MDRNTDPAAAGTELHRTLTYIQLWRLHVRLEYAALALVAAFAISVTAGLLILGVDREQITALGYPALWLFSLIRAASVLIPVPGGGVTVLAGATMDPLWGIPAPIAVGVTAGTAESIGEFTGYYAGVNGGKLMEGRRLYDRVRRSIERRAFLTTLAMSLAPSPVFDVAGIAAGGARVPIRVFYPAVLIGKVSRAVVMATLGYWGFETLQGFL
jgi:uncharacterized membrane protein YdjX (TVP38/TMEM64 family)